MSKETRSGPMDPSQGDYTSKDGSSLPSRQDREGRPISQRAPSQAVPSQVRSSVTPSIRAAVENVRAQFDWIDIDLAPPNPSFSRSLDGQPRRSSTSSSRDSMRSPFVALSTDPPMQTHPPAGDHSFPSRQTSLQNINSATHDLPVRDSIAEIFELKPPQLPDAFSSDNLSRTARSTSLSSVQPMRTTQADSPLPPHKEATPLTVQQHQHDDHSQPFQTDRPYIPTNPETCDQEPNQYLPPPQQITTYADSPLVPASPVLAGSPILSYPSHYDTSGLEDYAGMASSVPNAREGTSFADYSTTSTVIHQESSLSSPLLKNAPLPLPPTYPYSYPPRTSSSSLTLNNHNGGSPITLLPSPTHGMYMTGLETASGTSYIGNYGQSVNEASGSRRLPYTSGTPSPGKRRMDEFPGTPIEDSFQGYFDHELSQSTAGRASEPARRDTVTSQLASINLAKIRDFDSSSSIWYDGPDNDSQEKGFYGNLNRGLGTSGGAREIEKRVADKSNSQRKYKPWSKKKRIGVIGSLLLPDYNSIDPSVCAIGAIAAVVVVKRNMSSHRSGADEDTSSTSDGDQPSIEDGGTNTETGSSELSATSGGDGSRVTMENGTQFIYHNNFGGFWVSTAFNDSARPNSWTPPLHEPFDYSSNKIYGVNIGGWLTLEPFITPALYEPYQHAADPAVDEWTLSENLGTDLESTLTEHYETFITEQDFAQIAGAGLNWVRITLPYWAIETYDGEPFLEGLCWTYFLKAIVWARKYGLRINLDFHAVPGSQNGWNHSSKLGTVNFLNGVMGLANAQRTINYIRVLTEFISQPEYSNVIPMFGIINEAWVPTIGDAAIRAFYLEVYKMVRDISGIGESKGPIISIHDGFSGNLSTWTGFLSGSDRIVLDSHPYWAFTDANNDPMPVQIAKPCQQEANMFNTSMQQFGFTYAGEWSLGINDCGEFLNNVNNGTRYEGTYDNTTTVVYGDCEDFTNASTFNATYKAQLIEFAYAQMDTFQNWFFWTWKVGESSLTNRVMEGYIPSDPRGQVGACESLASKYEFTPPVKNLFGTLDAWMTGGNGAGQVAATQLASYTLWPPATINNAPSTTSLTVSLLPQFTTTGSSLVLTESPTPTTHQQATPVLTSAYYTPIADCSYPNPWSGAGAAQPTATCL